jgi:hypothetical protein
MIALGWLVEGGGDSYNVTDQGATGFSGLGLDVEAARGLRRRFAFGCLDWSERRAHLGGALGAAVLAMALKQKWVRRDLDSRALEVTERGSVALEKEFGIREGMLESE